ncbi:MAG: hypothetical protein ACJ76K_14395 [Solirubrobacteraceae bacterium]
MTHRSRPGWPRLPRPLSHCNGGTDRTRHVVSKVDDVRGIVDRVREAGWETVGEIVDFENTFSSATSVDPKG